MLTPLAVDPAHPFPYISGLSLNLAVILVNPKTGKEHFARVKVPPLLPRLLRVDAGTDAAAEIWNTRFVPLEDVIAAHLGELLPGDGGAGALHLRVTRNEDVEVGGRRREPPHRTRRSSREAIRAARAVGGR